MPLLGTKGAASAQGFGLTTLSQAVDAFFEYVTMLLPGNGTNGAQNNTFLDSSTNNFTITRNGNTTQGTFTPYGSNWSNYFEGTSNTNYLSIARLLDSNVDVTLECWVFMTASQPTNGAYVAAQFTAGGADRTVFGVIGAGNLVGMQFGTTSVTSTAAIQLNQWVHLAWVRSGNGTNNWSQYINGVRDGQLTYTGTYQNTPFTIGASNNIASSQFPGYISNMRLVKGTAVYSGTSFTPPSAPLTAITNTVLLTCQGNRFVDSSASPNTITVNGSPSVQSFQPFPGATTYSGTVLGGSGYFDGTGDFLNTPSTGQFAPSGDFTISCWYYPTSTRTFQQIIGNYNGTASTVWIFEITSGTGISFYTNGTTPRISGSGLVVNAWNYLVLARSGSTITGYVNGVSVGTYSQSGTFGSATQAISIGRGGSSTAAGDYALGYIGGVTLIDGSAVTTVPTAPQTATSGTSLLLNFTNAGIYDNSMMNDLETVGNAQVSTSVVKYGTGSMAFDGSGDYLKARFGDQSFALGSGDWTFEAWVYLNNTSGNQAVFIGQSDYVNAANASYLMYVTGSYAGYFYYGSSYVTLGAPGLSAGVWTHVAWVRNGGTITFYRNGTSIATVSISTNSINVGTTNPFCIGDATSGVVPFNGYLDDVRITKAARYITNFTPPPARLPAQ